MIVLDCPQRSDEWRQARVGRLCGSRAGDMLATLKSGGEAASRRDLRVQLALERILNVSQENGYLNADMERGIALEADALAMYEARTGQLLRSVGYVMHDSLLAGCSPDGLVGDDGLVEVKCPRSANHLAYWKAGTVPKDHLPQIVHGLWITERRWCDFISYDDRFPESLQFFCVRYPRNDVEVQLYQRNVEAFLAEVEAEVQTIQALAQAGVGA